MDSLERHAFSFIENALASIARDAAADAYAVSLFVYDEGDDPLRPTATVGFNTEARVAGEVESASDEHEARWNYAFWLQNNLGVLCESDSDPEGADVRDQWIRDSRLRSDDPEAHDYVTRQFVAVLERVVSALHQDGVIEREFGRPIPVLIHELEYYDEIAEQNQRANPRGLADKFIGWITAMYE
jgi:hypothetical protein